MERDAPGKVMTARPFKPVVLNRGGAPPPGGHEEISWGREPLHALQHEKFFNGNVYLPNVTPVRYFTSLLVIWFSSGRDGSWG